MKDKKITAYKVVDKKTRKGVNWTLYHYSEYFKIFGEDIVWVQQHPEYFPRYTRLNIIEEAPDSVGLMCLENEQCAKDYLTYITQHLDDGEDEINWKILKVEIKTKNIKKECKINRGAYPTDFTNKNISKTYDAPNGTVFCKKLKVLS